MGPKCSHIHADEGGAEGDETHTAEENGVAREAKTGVTRSQARQRQRPREAREGKETEPCEPRFQPSETDFARVASRTTGE